MKIGTETLLNPTLSRSSSFSSVGSGDSFLNHLEDTRQDKTLDETNPFAPYVTNFLNSARSVEDSINEASSGGRSLEEIIPKVAAFSTEVDLVRSVTESLIGGVNSLINMQI